MQKKNIFIFFFIVFSFLSANSENDTNKSYLLKALFDNEEQAQNFEKYSLYIDEIDTILEIGENNLFYDVITEKKEIVLEKKIYSYIVTYQDRDFSGEFVVEEGQKEIEIDLKNIGKESDLLKEITKVRAKKARKIPGGKISLTAKEARRIPGAGNDILRAVAALPGVQGSASANGEIFIRGSKKDDIYYTINNIRISNPFHTMTFHSAIPNILFANLNVYLGGFDTKFMNSQGGVIEIIPKKIKNYDSRQINFEGEVSTSFLSFNINFPILSNLRINLGARRSHYDVFLNGFLFQWSSEEKLHPFFLDANLFIDWEIDSKNYVKAFTIFSDDGSDASVSESYFSNVANAGKDLLQASGEENIQEGRLTEFTALNVEASESWNVQGIEHTFDIRFLKSISSVYHHGITNYSKLNGVNYGNYTKNEYSFKNDSNLKILDNIIFSLGGSISYQQSDLLVFENKLGKKKPTLNDFGIFHLAYVQDIYDNPFKTLINQVSFPGFKPNSPVVDKLASSIVFFDEESEQNYINFKKALIEYNENLEERILKPKRMVYSGYLSSDLNLSDVSIHLGGNTTYNDFSEKITIDPRFGVSYFLLQQYNFFFRAGKVSIANCQNYLLKGLLA